MADTLQCNLWRRAQTPHRMTHRLHGGNKHGKFNGYTALGKTIGTRKMTARDSEYVEEHSVLKYVRKKRAEYEPTLENCWYGRVVLLCRILVKTDMKNNKGRSVLKDCDCALIDCLYDYAPGRYNFRRNVS